MANFKFKQFQTIFNGLGYGSLKCCEGEGVPDYPLILNIEDAVEADAFQVNTFQYNDDGGIWFVDMNGVILQIIAPTP